MDTWSGRSQFKYEGSVVTGTTIFYGKECRYKVKINAEDYAALKEHFRGRTIKVGTSRDDPPRGSRGKWLIENVTKTATASYVAPILIEEGYAERVEEQDEIHILNI